MKKNLFLLLSLIFSICCLNVNAQNSQLWGMTSYGGVNQLGNIFKINADSTGLETVYSFGTIPTLSSGSHPENNLYQASDGKLYGMTNYGGLYNYGTIFSFDINSNTFTKLFDFNDSLGANPTGALVEANNGLLYGLTTLGGANGQGVLFSFDIGTNGYSKIHDFLSSGYYGPYGSLINGYDGKLYGLSQNGGNQGYGTIFKLDPMTDSFKVLQNLNQYNGIAHGSFYMASDSNLYAACYSGIMKYNIATNHVTLADSLGFFYLSENLTAINNWLLIGYDEQNERIITLNINNDSLDGVYDMPHYILNSYEYYPEGGFLKGTPVLADNGSVYGLASSGGIYNIGTLISYNPINNTFTKLFDFNDTLGSTPMGDLIQASNGKLYGMTNVGGAWNDGVIFSYDPVQNSYSKLFDFKGFYSADGSNPDGNLLHASNGLLYGMTSTGGNNKVGALFSYDANLYNYTKLFDFNLSQGGQPEGSLIQASDGNLYGMTLLGGTDTNHYYAQLDFQFESRTLYQIAGSGVIFKYDINSNTYNVLHYFDGSTGGVPYGNLMQGSNGKLYGMATYGGIYNDGVIFSFDINTNAYSAIHSFNDTAGANPYGSLIEASNGKLYGMTLNGGVYAPTDGRCGDFGVVFSLDTATYNYTVLQYFNYGNNSGQRPFGSLLQAGNGKLYGMTSGSSNGIDQVDNCTFGSSSNVFSIDIYTNTFTDISDLTGWVNPYGSLIQSGNGKIYGMSAFGGIYGDGDIFYIDTSSSGNYTIVNSFDGIKGYGPYGDLIEMPQGTGINQINKTNQVYLIAFPNPFNNSTTFKIKGTLTDKKAMLNIYDIAGREVGSLLVGDKSEITFNREELESGMYLYKLISVEKEIVASGKLIIY